MRIKTNRHSKKPIITLLFVGVFLFIGGVFAFNEDILTFNNPFRIGTHVATSIEEFESPDNWHVCEETPKTLITRNDSTHDFYVRLSYDEYWRAKDNETNLPLIKDGIRLAAINFQNEDDWELRDDGWYYFKEALKPGDSTTSLFKSVQLDCSASFGGDNVCHETETGYICEKPEDSYESAKYHLKITVQTSDDPNGFPEDEYCKITINPNDGVYNGSNEIYEQDVICGSTIDLLSTTRTDYELTGWTKSVAEEEDSTLPANTTNITLDKDTTLTANWLSTIRYNVTVDPNGGSYDNSTSPSSYQVRKDTAYALGEATNTGYFVDYWEVVSGTVDTAVDGRLTSDAFVVTSDVVLRAHWDKAVARIERTQKIYPSIMRAEAEAQTDDIITLLVDTEEVVTNEKKVTLDLNNHTVTGSLTNTTAGNLTIINGEINNPDGAAVTNNGILTLGVDDYDDEGVANVINDNVRLIGTTAGLMQTNNTYQLYYYDGYLEGDLGLVGGYDGSPFYRRAYDGVEVHYFPFVEHREAGERNYQHVELKNADNAVTKTSVHGDIYYYNMQDNIDVSALTGYKIYAVRNFDASYPITIDSGNNIDFDIVGYTINAGDNWTINGTLNIEDSETDDEAGIINYSRTISNNGALALSNAKLHSTTSNTLLNNYGALTMRNSTLSSANGRTIYISSTSGPLDIDNNSWVTSDSTSMSAVYNDYNGLNIAGGNYRGNYISIENTNGKTMTVSGGYAESTKTAIRNSSTLNITGGLIKGLGSGYAIDNGSGVTNVSGGEVTIEESSEYAAIGSGTVNITGGKVAANSVQSNKDSYAIYASTVTISGTAEIITNSERGRCYGIDGSHITINGGSITANCVTAIGATIGKEYDLTMNGGTITVNSTTGDAYGVNMTSIWNSTTVNDGTINAHSVSGEAIGVGASSGMASNAGAVYINGGTVTAKSDSGASYGTRIITTVIKGGKVEGGTYGVNAYNTLTIGTNDATISTTVPEIIGGSYAVNSSKSGTSVYFFDGILKGGTNAYLAGIIKAIPDGAIIHTETIGDMENSWLVEDEPYLEVNGVQYNSLTKAYNAAASGDIIKVIRDFSSSAVLPTNPSGKEITIDLNNHTLSYTQTLTNSGTINIEDNSTNKNGVIVNINSTATSTITNNGTLNIKSGKVRSNGLKYAIENSGTANISGGEVTIEESSSYAAVYGGTVNATGGKITATSTQSGKNSHAIYAYRLNISGAAEIIANSDRGTSTGATGDTITMRGGTITSNGVTAYGTDIGKEQKFYMYDGTITVNSTSGSAVGARMTSIWNSDNIYGGTITVHSNSGVAVGAGGIGSMGGNAGSVNVTGGTITVNSDNNNSYGIRIVTINITGGKVEGGTYGIETLNDHITIGADDGTISKTSPEIIGGQSAITGTQSTPAYFYDGILKGGTNIAENDIIKAIPDGAIQHTEVIDGIKNSWLEEGEAYLEVNGIEYKSLTAAYAAAGNNGTIKVIKDYATLSNLPTNPQNTEITIDLNGHNLVYSQTLANNGTLNIEDNSNGANGSIANNNTVATSTITNGGTLNIKSGKIKGSGKNHTISNTGTVNMTGGEVSTSDIAPKYASIYGKTVNISGGKVITASTQQGSNAIYAIDASTVTISGTANISVERTTGNCTGIYGTSTTINGGSITANCVTAVGASVDKSQSLTMNGGIITVNSTTGDAYGVNMTSIWNSTTVNDGTINAHSVSGEAIGAGAASGMASNAGAVYINGGTITAKSDNGTSYGTRIITTVIKGGKVEGGTYGVNAYNTLTIGTNDATISTTVPEIIGGSYAVNSSKSGTSVYFFDGVLKGGNYAYSDDIIKGIPTDSTIHFETQEIDGKEYDVRYLVPATNVARIGSTDYTSLKAALAAVQTGETIVLTDDNYIYETLTIPDTINNVTINMANNKLNTVKPIINNGNITITDSVSSNPTIGYRNSDTLFTNNGTLTINKLSIQAKNILVNTSGSTVTLSGATLNATNEGTAITNSGNVNISNNTNITGYKGISSSASGVVAISNSTISTTDEAVRINTGKLTITDSTITSSGSTALYQQSASEPTTLTDVIFNGRAIYNNSGTINATRITVTGSRNSEGTIQTISGSTTTITDSTLAATYDGTSAWSSDYSYSIINNAGTMAITGTTITQTTKHSADPVMRTILNSGTLDLTGNTITSRTVDAERDYRNTIGIYTSGTLNYNSGTLSVSRNNGYGIYTDGGTTTITSGTISVLGNVSTYGFYANQGSTTIYDGSISSTGGTAYGAYIANGSITMGEAEPTTSPNYGTENASVSTTNPNITAIGTATGIGLQQVDGVFNYYDGKITGSTNAKPVLPTKIEYLYEAKNFTDGDGYEYCILKFMRNS